MQVEQYIPNARLREFVKMFLFIESDTAISNFILPDTSIVLAARYSGNVAIQTDDTATQVPTIALSGIRRSSRHIHYSDDAANMMVIFEPGGAAAFFDEPLNELSEQSIAIDALTGYAGFNSIAEQLAAAADNKQRVAIMEQALLSKLSCSTSDKLISSAIQKLGSINNSIAIKDLAKELYISNDAFEKRFRRVTGMSPKRFATITRLKNIIQHHSPLKSLTDTALTAGYYDQAHFIKDFKAFTGKSPLAFFSEATPHW